MMFKNINIRLTVYLIVIYMFINFIIYKMKYGAASLLILRFLPSWDYVMLFGNIIVSAALIIFFFLKRKYTGAKIPYIHLYIIVMSFFIGISILAGVLTHGEAVRSMLIPDQADMFMDFFNSIQYGLEPYGNAVIYPPLINLFYALCGSLIPLDNIILSHAVYIRDLQMAWIVLYAVTMLTMLGISLVIWLFLRDEKIVVRVLFLLVTFLSLPFVFAVERGNSLLQTLLFLLLFLYWYKSEGRRWRYLSYISLGIATGIKIVPVIFGLLIIRRRAWKESGIAIAVVAFIFYVPFLVLDGDLSVLLSNIQHTTLLAQGSRVNAAGAIQMIGNGVYVNLWNSLDSLGRIINFNFWHISQIISVLIFTLSVGCVCFIRELPEWEMVTVLSLVLILLPGFSAVYCLCYMILPLVIFLRDNRGIYNRINTLYIISLLCMFIPIVNFRFAIFAPFREDAYLMRLSTLVESAALLIMLILIIGSIIQQVDSKMRRRILGGSGAMALAYALALASWQQPAISFVPGDMSIVNAAEGLVLENGRYCAIQPDGRLTLQTYELKQYGLIVAAGQGEDGAAVNLFLDGKKVVSHAVNNGNWFIYIPAEKIAALNLADTVDISLSYEGKNTPVPLSYAGRPRLTDVIYAGTYMDDISEGFWRKTREADLRMGKSAHVLLAGDIAKEGLLVRYNVPDNLLSANAGKDIEVDLYVDNRKIKSVPISAPGEQVVMLQASDMAENGVFPYALDLAIKCNAVYREDADGESLNNREQSIELVSIGNADAEPAVWSHWLKGKEIYYLPADELKNNGFSLTYHIDPARLQYLQSAKLKLDVIVDGEVVAQRNLNEETSDSLDG
ncbi:MAG: DUF2029 domain-containing protein, partial [Selenomonas sp.]|nr:DUF2029 domain-containing protein [Selenomonas sp.]